MTDRSYEIIVDGNEAARALCREWLEPFADFLTGESFKESDVLYAEQSRHMHHDDESVSSVVFEAHKLNHNGETPYVSYCVTVSVQRLWEEGGYWPSPRLPDTSEQGALGGAIGLEIVPVADDIDDECEENEECGSDEEPIENYLNFSDDLDMRSVKEVWRYFMDDKHYRPRKVVEVQYYADDGKLVEDTQIPNPVPNGPLPGDAASDDLLMLEMLDNSVMRGFSESDARELRSVLRRFGFDPDTTR